MSRFANKSTSCGIDSTLIIDVTGKRDDGRFWDFGKRREQRKVGANATRTSDRTTMGGSSRLAALLTRKHAGENRRVRLIDQNEIIAASMYSPKFVNEALTVLRKQLIVDGRLDSVSLYSVGPPADFPELDTPDWQEDDYDQQGNLLDPIKVKEGKGEEIKWVLKQKLFDNV